MTVATAIESSPLQPLLLSISDVKLMVTPEHFDRLCVQNSDLCLEVLGRVRLC